MELRERLLGESVVTSCHVQAGAGACWKVAFCGLGELLTDSFLMKSVVGHTLRNEDILNDTRAPWENPTASPRGEAASCEACGGC